MNIDEYLRYYRCDRHYQRIVLFLAETIIIIIAMLTGALEAMRTYAEGLLNNDRQRVMI